MKPLRRYINVVIKKPSSGAWIYRLKLIATVPMVDDIISITSPLNETRSIQFKLTNRYKEYANFVAQFTTDSASEFTI